MLILSPRNVVSIRSAEAGFVREFKEKLPGFIRDAVLRVVEIDARGLNGHASAARVIRKQCRLLTS